MCVLHFHTVCNPSWHSIVTAGRVCTWHSMHLSQPCAAQVGFFCLPVCSWRRLALTFFNFDIHQCLTVSSGTAEWVSA